mmetsp:Transcript_11549/g.26319  ORF Transcript_11549/g.26319 Transcript_11549/m.26319 type:complete len:203 (-) Transcript_11549:3403-4011(-)
MKKTFPSRSVRHLTHFFKLPLEPKRLPPPILIRLWRQSMTKEMKKLKMPWMMAVPMLTIKPQRLQMLLLMMMILMLLLLTTSTTTIPLKTIPQRNRSRMGLPLLLTGRRQVTIQVKSCQKGKEMLPWKTVIHGLQLWRLARKVFLIKMRKWQIIMRKSLAKGQLRTRTKKLLERKPWRLALAVIKQTGTPPMSTRTMRTVML